MLVDSGGDYTYIISPPIAKYTIAHIIIAIIEKRIVPDTANPNMDIPTFSDFNPFLPKLMPIIAIITIIMRVNIENTKPESGKNNRHMNNRQIIMIPKTIDFLA